MFMCPDLQHCYNMTKTKINENTVINVSFYNENGLFYKKNILNYLKIYYGISDKTILQYYKLITRIKVEIIGDNIELLMNDCRVGFIQ